MYSVDQCSHQHDLKKEANDEIKNTHKDLD